MPSFTVNVPNLNARGPIIEVLLSPSQAAQQAVKISGETPGTVKVVAMIDTGASHSVISSAVAQNLKSMPVGQIKFASVHGSDGAMANQYAVDIQFPGGIVGVKNVMMTESALEGQSIQALIGRDVLQHGVLVYIGYQNQFTLSF